LPELKPTYMLEEYEKKKQKQVSIMRSVLNYGVGILMIALGCLLFLHEKLNVTINPSFSHETVRILGVVFVLYGGWRIYKGYKKNYFQ